MNPNLFKTQINGVPCFCEVEAYRPGKPDTFEEEGYDEEFYYVILDEYLAPAAHLQSQMTDEDDARLLEEYHVTRLEFKHYIES